MPDEISTDNHWVETDESLIEQAKQRVIQKNGCLVTPCIPIEGDDEAEKEADSFFEQVPIKTKKL